MLFGGAPNPSEQQVAPVPAHVPTELDEILGDKVLQWRCKQFIDAGFSIHQARRLTLDRAVDLHYVIYRLVGRGCPIDTAFDIAS